MKKIFSILILSILLFSFLNIGSLSAQVTGQEYCATIINYDMFAKCCLYDKTIPGYNEDACFKYNATGSYTEDTCGFVTNRNYSTCCSSSKIISNKFQCDAYNIFNKKLNFCVSLDNASSNYSTCCATYASYTAQYGTKSAYDLYKNTCDKVSPICDNCEINTIKDYNYYCLGYSTNNANDYKCDGYKVANSNNSITPATSGTNSITPATGNIGFGVKLKNPLGVDTIQGAIKAFMGAIVRVALPFIVVFFIYSGFSFITARGNPEAIKTAKNTFYYTIIGTLLILGAWAITNAIIGTINGIAS